MYRRIDHMTSFEYNSSRIIIIFAIVLSLIHDFRTLNIMSSHISWHNHIQHTNRWRIFFLIKENFLFIFTIWFDIQYDVCLIYLTHYLNKILLSFVILKTFSCFCSWIRSFNELILQSTKNFNNSFNTVE